MNTITFRKNESLLLTNRVRGPYCKCRPSFILSDLLPKREVRGHKSERKKQGSVRTEKNELSKI